ncbi:DELLA protein RGL2-like [Solanum dulcamara]|uniref:DELLA protein RGL2-like n=1 Tax=Solanum dulcamara TaxID=45834 RepID=UPI002486239A|nr:DELLA protein RGL2-like [Solanum dulcamara]
MDLQIKMGMQWTILMQALVTHQHNAENPLEYLKITAFLGVQSRTNVEETDCYGGRYPGSHFDIDPEEAIVVYSQYLLSNMLTQQDRLDFLMGFIKGLYENNESTRTTMESEVMWHGIRNIVAVEGEERTIRHVTIELWRKYFKRFGMEEMKMSNSSLYQAKMVVEKFSSGNSFTLEMNENFIAIGWKGTPLNSLSAWKFHKRSVFHRAYITL